MMRKLVVVAMVVMTMMLAACTTSIARPTADVRVIPQPCVQVIHHRAPGILSSSFHLPPASAAFR